MKGGEGVTCDLRTVILVSFGFGIFVGMIIGAKFSDR